MQDILLPRIGTLTQWRRAAKRLMYDRVPPSDVGWHLEGDGVVERELPPAPAMFRLRVSERFLTLSDRAIWHNDPVRFGLLYELLWRMRVAPKLVSDRDDDVVAGLLRMEDAVLRQERLIWQRLKFVDRGEWLVAEMAPRLPVLEHMAPQFAARFNGFDWLIQSPDITVRCKGGQVRLGAGIGDLQPQPARVEPAATPPLPGLFDDYAPTSGGLNRRTPLIFQP